MSNPSLHGQCSVCGAPSTQRCSACSKAGFDLFFCSQKHQKLVWPAHKLSCGMGTTDKPFQFPPLTQEELDSAKEILTGPSSTNKQLMTASLEACLVEAYAKKGAFRTLEVLSEVHYGKELPPQCAAAALYFVRIFVVGSQETSTADIGLAHKKNLTRHVQATLSAAFAQPFMRDPLPILFQPDLAYPLSDPLYIHFQHRMLIKLGVEQSRNKETDPRLAKEEQARRRDLIRYSANESLKAVKALEVNYPTQVANLEARMKETAWNIWNDIDAAGGTLEMNIGGVKAFFSGPKE
ncbi:hypothetical protein JCM8097_005253 [Rhodosporidiobolus ruineniae]